MKKKLPDEFKAYQWALPDSLDVPPDELQVRLDFYGDSVMLYSLDKGVIKARMVSARDITMALLSEVPLSSGITAPGCAVVEAGERGSRGCTVAIAQGVAGSPPAGGI